MASSVKQEPPRVQLANALASLPAEVERVCREMQERAEALNGVGQELLRLTGEEVPREAAGSRAAEVERSIVRLMEAINALAFVQTASVPVAEAFPACLGMASSFKADAERYREEQKAEREKQHRARQYQEREAFEEELEARLRSGDRPEAVEEERRRFQERQAGERPAPRNRP